MWDYAKLSKAAKSAGSPEKLINSIYSKGISKGKQSMLPLLLVTGAAGAIIYREVEKAANYLKQKSEKSKAELEAAKKELIDGINEYDKNNSNNK